MLNDFISSCSAQATISQEVAQGENFEISFFKLEYYHFWCINCEMNLTK